MHPPGLVLCWKLECSDHATQCCWPPPGLTEVPETHVAGIFLWKDLGWACSLDSRITQTWLRPCHFHAMVHPTSLSLTRLSLLPVTELRRFRRPRGLGCCCSPLPGLILCNLLSFFFLLPTPSYSVICHQKEWFYLISTILQMQENLFSWKGQQH